MAIPLKRAERQGSVDDGSVVLLRDHQPKLLNQLTKQTDPDKIEQDLMKLWPRELWIQFSHCLVFHGRTTCQARTPYCSRCVVNDLCPFPKTAQAKRIAK